MRTFEKPTVLKQVDASASGCTCSLSIRVLGDGCQTCNPEYGEDFLKWQDEEDEDNG